ncbi:hypothetical protein SAMN05518672_10679 [Chitinophaga sp. CF118]|uniref:tetratricopeptide repeat protein n=1 Tax=Chitinophaga sp. CF118 TaxID=1884367 RepID=UPI0008F34BD1|nr:tetratricopeptide repeat protein [Chitinophaga sp. CF118]SFE42435.1 hypothetical protein SAMN05518672_10679 [Chitinophaga sp. CF118]
MSENIKTIRRLYTATRKMMLHFEASAEKGIFEEQNTTQAIININEMIALLPSKYPTTSPKYPDNTFIAINQDDGEDEPKEQQQGFPAGTMLLFKYNAQTILEDWKFLIWSRIIFFFKAAHEKYIPLVLAQADICLAFFAEQYFLREWEKGMIVFYCNQIGWAALEYEKDPHKLGIALDKMKRGVDYADWQDRKYIKETWVRLLLKAGRKDEAYEVVSEVLQKNQDDPDFADLKADVQYVDWVKNKALKEKNAKQEKKKAYKSFLRFVAEEQAKVTGQFENPEHPLVIKHAAVLNLIKQRMVSVKLHLQYSGSGWETANEETDDDTFVLHKLSLKELEQFEKINKLPLPEELKVYLMEIGEGGEGYFCYGGVNLPAKAKIKKVKKPFPVTPDKIHPIKHYWKINAWIDPSDKDEWVEEKVFKKKDDLEALFGLPGEADTKDGCLYLGPSFGQDELYLIMNGAFEGEVWVDTLSSGPEVGGCLGAASQERLTFLPFIAESLLANQQGYVDASDKGAWI